MLSDDFERQDFSWHRVKNISFEEYQKDFLNGDKEKIQAAYKRAFKLRDFEINLYWKRAVYFWAFITTIYAAYYKVWNCALCNCKLGTSLLLVVLAGLGFFFSVAWIFVLDGSKHWQENWEHHIDLLEDYVTGPLYKTYQSGSISVSKVNSAIAWVIAVCTGAFFVVNLKEYFVIQNFNIALSLLTACACVFICLLVFWKCILGNVPKKGSVVFDQKRR